MILRTKLQGQSRTRYFTLLSLPLESIPTQKAPFILKTHATPAHIQWSLSHSSGSWASCLGVSLGCLLSWVCEPGKILNFFVSVPCFKGSLLQRAAVRTLRRTLRWEPQHHSKSSWSDSSPTPESPLLLSCHTHHLHFIQKSQLNTSISCLCSNHSFPNLTILCELVPSQFCKMTISCLHMLAALTPPGKHSRSQA